jgi:hypothetical protein
MWIGGAHPPGERSWSPQVTALGAGSPVVPYAWLPAVVHGTLIVALLTAVPIRAAGRRAVARILGTR